MNRKYPFTVVYEDNHLIIVNKEIGVLVQGDSTGDTTLSDMVKDYIAQKYEKEGAVFLGTVHRLDRPVSGLVVFARTSKALERMNELFRRRDIQKTYWAIVQKRPEEKQGKLTHWLVKNEARNTVKAYNEPVENAQKAELSYKVIGELNKYYLLEVKPVTGRPHQIRVQLAAMGCPIRGDVKYGYPKATIDGGISLHARRLYFIHPVKKEPLVCKAALPDGFWEDFLALDPDKEDKDIHLELVHLG